MAQHVSLMDAKKACGGAALLRDLRNTQRLLTHAGPRVIALQTENVIVHGQKREVRRLFVRTADSGDYYHVGYVLDEDLDCCMVCNTEFGVFNVKGSCRACGNLICSKCSPETGTISLFYTCELL